MKQAIKKVTSKLAEAGVFWLGLAAPVLAQPETDPRSGAESARPTEAPSDLFGPGGIFRKVTNTLIFLIGAIAVLMLIVGGVRYVVSAGNDTAVQGAKNTILYAVIGLIIAIIAFAAVNFLLDQLQG